MPAWKSARRAAMNSGSNVGVGDGFMRCWSVAESGGASDAELARRQLLHDLRGAAADHHDLDLAVDALALRAAHVAHGAHDLHRLVGAELHRLRRVVLEQAEIGDPLRIAAAGIVALDEGIEPGAAAGDAHAHVDELVPDRLVLD